MGEKVQVEPERQRDREKEEGERQMKETLERIVMADRALAKIGQCTKLPAMALYRLAVLKTKTEKHATAFETARQASVKKYGIPNDNGGLTVPLEKMDEFTAEMQAVIATEVDIDFEKPVQIPGNVETGLTIEEMGGLLPFVSIKE